MLDRELGQRRSGAAAGARTPRRDRRSASSASAPSARRWPRTSPGGARSSSGIGPGARAEAVRPKVTARERLATPARGGERGARSSSPVSPPPARSRRSSTAPTACSRASDRARSSSTAPRAIPRPRGASPRASPSRGVAFADAPVSGGTNGAEAGTLTVMVGADAAHLRAGPHRARGVRRAGSCTSVRSATGHAMKAVNNALLARQHSRGGRGVGRTGEGRRRPPGRRSTCSTRSSGRSFVSETLVPERVLTGALAADLPPGAAGEGRRVSRASCCGRPGWRRRCSTSPASCFCRARAALGEEADYLEAIRLIEAQAGVEIRG